MAEGEGISQKPNDIINSFKVPKGFDKPKAYTPITEKGAPITSWARSSALPPNPLQDETKQTAEPKPLTELMTPEEKKTAHELGENFYQTLKKMMEAIGRKSS